jgi:hypothetical protein
MSDHSEQKSTKLSTVNPGVLGGLVLLSMPFIPILAVMGLFTALDVITETTKDTEDTQEEPGEEDINGKMD